MSCEPMKTIFLIFFAILKPAKDFIIYSHHQKYLSWHTRWCSAESSYKATHTTEIDTGGLWTSLCTTHHVLDDQAQDIAVSTVLQILKTDFMMKDFDEKKDIESVLLYPHDSWDVYSDSVSHRIRRHSLFLGCSWPSTTRTVFLLLGCRYILI